MKKYKVFFNDGSTLGIEAVGFKEEESFINFYVRETTTEKKIYTFVVSSCNMKYVEIISN
ncbi:hypothetical protein AAEX28_05490 [Lentisphaerota bacterium WC36G]|nr:hypothetical protein LJT99_08350 [Lentisphaerae bacterium WC36]